MQAITTISLDIAKVFQIIASMQMAIWFFAVSSSDDMFWRSFQKWPSFGARHFACQEDTPPMMMVA